MSVFHKRYDPQFLFLQHDSICPPCLATKILQIKNIDFKVVYSHYPNAFNGIHPSMFKGIIVLGGYMSVWDHDNHPWLKDVKSFLKIALDHNVPILGICLGAQILANVIGGDNYKGDKGPEFGYYDINWTNDSTDDELSQYTKMNKLHKTFVYSHSNAFSFPYNKYYVTNNREKLNIKILGETNNYIAFYKVGEMTYGIQPHPEADYQLQNIWISLDEKVICSKDKNAATKLLKQADECKMIQEKNSMAFHAKWFSMCLERQNNQMINSKL